jgi:hypothetical protein
MSSTTDAINTNAVALEPERPMWWEKTVEYAFVRRILPATSCAAPLAGNAEKFFGDLMNLEGDGKARLIEFKREESNISDEVLKYYAKGKAKGKEFHSTWLRVVKSEDCLGAKGHWFVYGKLNERESSELDLWGKQYGPATAVPLELKTDAQLGYVPAHELHHYMQLLGKGRIRGGDWMSSMVVAMFNGRNTVMTPQQFIHKSFELDLTLGLNPPLHSYVPKLG